tara:strand:+ start:1407 stop:1748 length:342 start_codon:yes stop_codon:yes gene_type:complete
MSHWVLVTYTRPNTDTAWYEPTAEAKELMNTLKDDDIVNPSVEVYQKIETADGLKQYYKICFREESISIDIASNSVYIDNETIRNDYCSVNGISCDIEHVGETEPETPTGIGG